MRLPIKEEAAFREYCALGPGRSLEKLFEVYQNSTKYIPNSDKRFKPSISTIKKWSSTYEWQKRVLKWDQDQFEARQRKREAEREKMDERHAQIGVSQQMRAIQRIEQLMKADNFNAQATVQLLDLATKLERIARGGATERKEVSGPAGGAIPIKDEAEPMDLSALSDEELDQLQMIHRKLKEQRIGSSEPDVSSS
jgi:hypothetical protein